MLGERDRKTERERERKRERDQERKTQNTLRIEVSGKESREDIFFFTHNISLFQQMKGHSEQKKG